MQRGGMCEQLQWNPGTDTSCLAPRLPLFSFDAFFSTVRCNVPLGPQVSSVTVRVLITFHCRLLLPIHTINDHGLPSLELLCDRRDIVATRVDVSSSKVARMRYPPTTPAI
jgi:hypothetical protein